jgi:hypothetical protein
MRIHRPHPDVTVLGDTLEVPGLGHLPINAFVLHAAQPVVVDTGLGLADRDFVATLAEAIDPADVRWIWLTHPDRDHTGGIFALLEAAPQARLVTTFVGVGVMSTERPLPIDRVYLLNPGQTLDVGDRTLLGFRPPLFDNPATVGCFDQRSGVVFSSDCFGAPLATAELASADTAAEASPDDLRAAQLLWASVDSRGCTGSTRRSSRPRSTRCAPSTPRGCSAPTCHRSRATPYPCSTRSPPPRTCPSSSAPTRPPSTRCSPPSSRPEPSGSPTHLAPRMSVLWVPDVWDYPFLHVS